MAKTISDEVIKLSIILDGNVAQKELFELEKSTRKLNEENKGLLLQKKLLEKQGKQDTEQYKLLTATIKQNTKEIADNKAKMAQLQDQLGLTGLTINQLNQKATILRATLRNLVPGSADYNRYEKELQQVTNRLSELRGRATAAKFSLSSIADSFNRYQALAVSVVATLTGVVFSIQKMIDYNGKLSDAQANVMKTTKMTKQEVDELGKSFGLLETRTSRINLYKIAEQGGRLGIPKEEIADFVRNMDVAAVALGDSFTGGVDQVAEKLGKIKFLFKETKDLGIDSAYASIGSAINELGADGVASEANIAEFTTRIGSLTDVLKPTVQETLALGAAFEESGIEAEISARAYNIFMKQASTEASKFAQVMGISKKAVEDMINTNPLNFMLEFSKGLNGMNATEVAKTLDFLGVNADGANKVVGAMGNNFDRFHELIKLSNTSFQEGTSLINEYNVKNENLAATLEKIGKRVAGIFSSEAFTNWLAGVVTWFAKLIGATEDADGKVEGFRNRLIFLIKVITIVIASYISYNAALRLTALWTRTVSSVTSILTAIQNRGAVVTGLLRSAQLLLSAAYYAVTGNTTRATAAMRLFNATAASNPIGLIVAAVVSLVTAFVLFKKNSDEASKSLKAFSKETDIANAINKKFSVDFAKASSDLKAKIEPLIEVLNNQNVSLHTRKAAYEKLIAIAPEFRGTVDKEFMATDKLNQVYKDLIANMEEKMRFQAMQSVLQAAYDAEAKAIEKIVKAENRLLEAQKANEEWNKKRMGSGAVNVNQRLEIRDATEELKNAQNELTIAEKNASLVKDYRTKQVEKLTKEQKKYVEGSKEFIDIQNKINLLLGLSSTKTETTPTKSNYKVPGETQTGETKKNPNSTAAELKKLDIENESNYNDIIIKLRRELEDKKIALMQEGYEKELAIENLRFKREVEDLESQKIHSQQMAKLDEDIAKALEEKDISKYNALLKIKKGWGEKNKAIDTEINKIIEDARTIHFYKLATIHEKEAQAELKRYTEQHEREKLARETAYFEELALIGNDEKAKAKLKKKYEEEELAAQKAFLEKLVSENKRILEGLNSKVDLTLLTPEQKQAFEDNVNELINKIAKLKAEIAELKGNPASGTDFNILSGAGTDILGFSPEQWEQVFSNLDTAEQKIQAFGTVIGGLQNVWSMYSGFAEANLQRELNALERSGNTKKRKLKQQLDQGLINQAQYKKGVEKIDTDIEKKRAEIEYKKARNERIGALFGIATNTALGIMKSVAASPLTGGMPWAGIIAGMGALQAAMVLASPMPAKGAEKGLYNPEYIKRSQDGKVFKNTGTTSMKTGAFSKPTLLVGEGPGDMPEMVIDKRSFARISPSVKEALIRELNGVRGFENGYYDNLGRYTVPVGNEPKSTNNNNDDLILMLMGVVKENTETMRDLRENGVIGKFFRDDKRSMKEIEQGIKEYLELKDKAKQ